MRSLILCAGLGERLRPLTLQRAKPAIEFLNLPMLAFPYYWLNTVGLTDIVFNTHYLPESIRHAAMHVVNPNQQLHFTHEETILGSGGGIWNARFELQWEDTFAVANGDGVIACAEPDLFEAMLRFHRRKNALATLLVCPLEGVGTQIPGVWLDSYDEVAGFGKTSPAAEMHCRHYASFLFFSKRLWDHLPQGPSNILYDVLLAAMAKGEKVYGFDVESERLRWFETGNIPEYLQATQTCLEFIREGNRMGEQLKTMLEHLASPFSLHTDWSQSRLIADSATLADGVQLNGFSVIGADATIGKGTVLTNCVVQSGAQVGANLDLKNQVLI